MTEGNSSSSSSSDSSKDEDECLTLAQLNRKKNMVPPSETLNEDIHKDIREGACLSSSEYEQEESEEEEDQGVLDIEEAAAILEGLAAAAAGAAAAAAPVGGAAQRSRAQRKRPTAWVAAYKKLFAPGSGSSSRQAASQPGVRCLRPYLR